MNLPLNFSTVTVIKFCCKFIKRTHISRFLYNVCLTFHKNLCSSYSCIKFVISSSVHSLLLSLLILKEFLKINRHKCHWDVKMSSNSDGRYETGWSRCIHLIPLFIAVTGLDFDLRRLSGPYPFASRAPSDYFVSSRHLPLNNKMISRITVNTSKGRHIVN